MQHLQKMNNDQLSALASNGQNSKCAAPACAYEMLEL